MENKENKTKQYGEAYSQFADSQEIDFLKKLDILETFAKQIGFYIDNVTNGLGGGMVYYKHILNHDEIIVEWSKRHYTIRLHDSVYFPKYAKELAQQLIMMDYLANYTYDLLN